MAITTSCCLNLSPPTSACPNNYPNSIRPKASQVSWEKKEATMRSQCVAGVAFMVIGLGMGNSLVVQETYAATHDAHEMTTKQRDKITIGRWSEKRSCPPWKLKSFEHIVPENLPRPQPLRKWEPIANSNTTADPPTTTLKRAAYEAKSNPSCFSM